MAESIGTVSEYVKIVTITKLYLMKQNGLFSKSDIARQRCEFTKYMQELRRCGPATRDTSETAREVLFLKPWDSSDWPLPGKKRWIFSCNYKIPSPKSCRPVSLVTVKDTGVSILTDNRSICRHL
jgi:hypothetical protein